LEYFPWTGVNVPDRIDTRNNPETGMANTKAKPVSETAARLGSYVTKLRTERGLSIRALAGQAGVDWSWLAKLEHGRYVSPDARSLWRVARALDVETADLYLEAGFGDARGLPGFRPYLRAKYHLPQEAIAQLEDYFVLINEKYRADKKPEEFNDE
jgi:transcriptional regulator with XRE-family HTH domain